MLETKVTLRIFSETHSLSQLKEFFGEPTRGFSKGDFFSREKKFREKSFWSFESKLGPDEKFESHVIEIINFIEKNKAALNALQNECEIDLFCMLSSDNGQGGFIFPYELAGEISRYQLNIVFDIYAE